MIYAVAGMAGVMLGHVLCFFHLTSVVTGLRLKVRDLEAKAGDLEKKLDRAFSCGEEPIR